MIRIEMIWLALGASDLRGGIDILLAQVLRGFAGGAQAHHAYVFANRRADRLKVLWRRSKNSRSTARLGSPTGSSSEYASCLGVSPITSS